MKIGDKVITFDNREISIENKTKLNYEAHLLIGDKQRLVLCERARQQRLQLLHFFADAEKREKLTHLVLQGGEQRGRLPDDHAARGRRAAPAASRAASSAAAAAAATARGAAAAAPAPRPLPRGEFLLFPFSPPTPLFLISQLHRGG
jgi:hypothetical protein